MTRSPQRSRMRQFAASCALALAAATGAAQANDAYPDKPITIVVPFSPGSATDTSARILTEKLGPRLGVPIVIENKPGASGTIGSSTAARAAPDGYTLILTSSSTHSATPALFRKLPYDPTGDFIHVIRIATIPMMLVVRAESPYGSVSQLVQATRARPLNYAYGSPTSQIAGATFNSVAGAGGRAPEPRDHAHPERARQHRQVRDAGHAGRAQHAGRTPGLCPVAAPDLDPARDRREDRAAINAPGGLSPSGPGRPHWPAASRPAAGPSP